MLRRTKILTTLGPATDNPKVLADMLRAGADVVRVNFSHGEPQAHAKRVYDPFALADERDHLHRFHYEDSRALLALDDPAGTQPFLDRFQELWEASGPAASATTLGL